MTTEGPFLYDEGPAPLHTGTPRRSGKILVLIFGGTVLAALLMVFLSVTLKGSGEDQAKEVTGVFFAALGQDDTETAYGLLCQEERNRLDPGEVAGAYQGEGDFEIGAVQEDGDARLVTVGWADGTSSDVTVIGEDGLRICGTALRG
jgi:outer membrane translocation and assembly module TamA